MGYITGRVQERDGQLQLVLEKLEPVSLEKFWILLENREHDYALLVFWINIEEAFQ